MKPKSRTRAIALLAALLLLPACGNDTISVIDKNGDTVTVTSSGDGSYAFKLPQGGANTTETTPLSENPFEDVSEGAWYYDPILYCYRNHLMRGTTQTTFSPSLSTTRGMIAATLWRLEGSPAAGENPFADVPDTQYYAQAIAWAAEEGIVSGYSDTVFAPEASVSRQEMVAMLYRYVTYKGYDASQTAFLGDRTDSGAVSAYALSAVSWAVANGIIADMGDGTLRPQEDATRAQVAAIFMNFRENILQAGTEN